MRTTTHRIDTHRKATDSMHSGTAFPPTASGTHHERFAPVVARFEEHLASTPHGGASLAVVLDGVPVIDIWGGIADSTRGVPWRRNTLALPFSCSKSVMTIVVLTLAELGILDLDTPLAHHWPAFAAQGKDRITVRDVLSHRAGLPLVDAPLTFADVCDGRPLVAALEDQVPLWEPGSAHEYHAITVGALIGETVRRATGSTVGEILRTHLSGPLDLDLWIGLPHRHHDRVALTLPPSPTDYIPEKHAPLVEYLRADDRTLRALTLNGAVRIPVLGMSTVTDWNDPRLWAAELPAGNAMTTAVSLAKLHAALITDTVDHTGATIPPILSPSTLSDARTPRSEGAPAIAPNVPPFQRWGTGFMLPSAARPMLSEHSFGHDGAAGGLCFADDEHRVGFAFLPNVMTASPDHRVDRIVDELRQCLTR